MSVGVRTWKIIDQIVVGYQMVCQSRCAPNCTKNKVPGTSTGRLCVKSMWVGIIT